MEKIYVKLEVKDAIACYIDSNTFATFFAKYIYRPCQRTMIEFAEVVIDLESDSIIKCRQPLDQIFSEGFPRPVLTMYFSGVL